MIATAQTQPATVAPPTRNWEIQELFSLPPLIASGIRDAFTKAIRTDDNSSIFSGELVVTPLLPDRRFDWNSAHLMTFGGHDQSWHRHPGERCLFIIAAGPSTTWVSDADPDATEDEIEARAHPLPMAANTANLFRMQANTWHRFEGPFCAVSFHPDDSKNIDDVEATLGSASGPMEAFTAYPRLEG